MSFKVDYDRWKNDQRIHLEKLSDSEVLFLFTGGKDCSLILDFMSRAMLEFDFRFRIIAGRYPNTTFPEEKIKKIDKYWRSRGLEIDWVMIEKNDDEFENALQKGLNPCTVCHSKKLGYLDRLIEDCYPDKEPLVVIYGFSLWDMVSYSLEYLLGDKYANASTQSLFQGDKARSRFSYQTSRRFYPFLKTEAGFYAYCPLLRYNDPEIKGAINEKKIPLLKVQCQYDKYRPKRILQEVYEKMGMVFDYDKVFSFSQRAYELDEHVLQALKN